jgi:hypothetical protein
MGMHIDHNGVGHMVAVDDEGQFRVIIDGKLFIADTLAELREKVQMEAQGPRVHVPFSVAQAGDVRHGMANAIRRLDGSIMVTWEDNGTYTPMDWESTVLRRLGDDEMYTYRSLLDTLEQAKAAVRDFEQPRRIDLKAAVVQARRSWEAGDLG